MHWSDEADEDHPAVSGLAEALGVSSIPLGVPRQTSNSPSEHASDGLDDATDARRGKPHPGIPRQASDSLSERASDEFDDASNARRLSAPPGDPAVDTSGASEALGVSGETPAAASRSALEEAEHAISSLMSPPPGSAGSEQRPKKQLFQGVRPKALGISVEGFGVSGNHSEEADDTAHLRVAPPPTSNLTSPRGPKAHLMQGKALTPALRSAANRAAGRSQNLGGLMRLQKQSKKKEIIEGLQAKSLLEGKAAAKSSPKKRLSGQESMEATEQEEDDLDDFGEDDPGSPVSVPSSSPLSLASPTHQRSSIELKPEMDIKGTQLAAGSADARAGALLPPASPRQAPSPAASASSQRSGLDDAESIKPELHLPVMPALPRPTMASRRKSAEEQASTAAEGLAVHGPRSGEATEEPEIFSKSSSPRPSVSGPASSSWFRPPESQRTSPRPSESVRSSPRPSPRHSDAFSMLSNSPIPESMGAHLGIGRSDGHRPSVVAANMMAGIRRGSTAHQHNQTLPGAGLSAGFALKTLSYAHRSAKKARNEVGRRSSRFLSDPGKRAAPDTVEEEEEDHAKGAQSSFAEDSSNMAGTPSNLAECLSPETDTDEPEDPQQQKTGHETSEEAGEAGASDVPKIRSSSDIEEESQTLRQESPTFDNFGEEDGEKQREDSSKSSSKSSSKQLVIEPASEEAPERPQLGNIMVTSPSDASLGGESVAHTLMTSPSVKSLGAESVGQTLLTSPSAKSLGVESEAETMVSSPSVRSLASEGVDQTMAPSPSQKSLGSESIQSPASTRTSERKRTNKRGSVLNASPRSADRKATESGRRSVEKDTGSRWSKLRKAFGKGRSVTMKEESGDQELRRNSIDEPRRESGKLEIPLAELRRHSTGEPDMPNSFQQAFLARRVGVSVEDREEYLKNLRMHEISDQQEDEDLSSTPIPSPASTRSNFRKGTRKGSASGQGPGLAAQASDTDNSEPSRPVSARVEARKQTNVGGNKLKTAVAKITAVSKLFKKDKSKAEEPKAKKQLRMLALNVPGASRIVRRRSDDTKPASPTSPTRRNSMGEGGMQRRISAGASTTTEKKEKFVTTSYADGTRDDSSATSVSTDGQTDRFRSFLQRRQLFSTAKARFEQMEKIDEMTAVAKLAAAGHAIAEGVRKIHMQQHIVDSFWTTLAEKQMRLKIATMLQDTLQSKNDAGMPVQCGQPEVAYMSQCFARYEEELSNMKAGEKGAHLLLKSFQMQVQKAHKCMQRQREAAAELYDTEAQLRKAAESANENATMLWRKVWNANAFVNRVKMSTRDLKDAFIEFGMPKVSMAVLANAGLKLSDLSEAKDRAGLRDAITEDDLRSPTRRDSTDARKASLRRSTTGKWDQAIEAHDIEDAETLLENLPEEALHPLREELRAQGAGHVPTQVKCARELGKLGVLWKDLPRVVQAFCGEVWHECVSRAINMLSEANGRDAASLRSTLREIEDRLNSEFPGSKPQLLKLTSHRTSGELYVKPRESEEAGAEDEQDTTSIADVDPVSQRCRRGSICPEVHLEVSERVSTPAPGSRRDGDDDQLSFDSSTTEGDPEPKDDLVQELASTEELGRRRASAVEVAKQRAMSLDMASIPGRRLSMQELSHHAASVQCSRRSSTTQDSRTEQKVMRAKAADILASLTDPLGVGVLAMSRRPSAEDDSPKHTARKLRHMSFSMGSPTSPALRHQLSLSMGSPSMKQLHRSSFSLGSSPMSWSGGLQALYEKCSKTASPKSQYDDDDLLERRWKTAPELGALRRPSFMTGLAAHAQKLKDKFRTADARLEQGEFGVLPSEEKQTRQEEEEDDVFEGNSIRRKSKEKATLQSPKNTIRRESTPNLLASSRRGSLSLANLSRPGSRLQMIPRSSSRGAQASRPGSRAQHGSRPGSRRPSKSKRKVEQISISPRLRGEWGSVKAQRQRAAGRTVAAWLGHLPKSHCAPEVERPRTSGCDRKAGGVPHAKRPLFLVADSFITPVKSRFQAAQHNSRPATSGTSMGFGLSAEFAFSTSLVESDGLPMPKSSPSSRPGTSGSCGISRSKNGGTGDSVVLFLPVLSGFGRKIPTPNSFDMGESGRGSITPQASPRGSLAGC